MFCLQAAFLLDRGEEGVKELVQVFESEGAILVRPSNNRGRGSATWQDVNKLLTPPEEKIVREEIKSTLKKGERVVTKFLTRALQDRAEKIVNEDNLRNYMKKKMKLIWGRAKTQHAPQTGNPAKDKARIRQFLIEYNSALKEQQEGKATIVYSDETFCYTCHHHEMTWMDPSMGEEGMIMGAGGEKGERLTVVHAITRDGLLYIKGHEAPLQYATGEQLTAELIFKGKDTKDYHKTVCCKKRVWAKCDLFPPCCRWMEKCISNGSKSA